MTRTLTTVPGSSTVARRAEWRFRSLIAMLVAATIGLVVWVGVQQRQVAPDVDPVLAPAHQSIRQVEHAAEVRAALEHLDDSDVRRFRNRVGAIAPVRPDPEALRGLESAELRRFRNRISVPEYERPGVQP